MTAAITKSSSASTLIREAWSRQFRGSCLSYPAEFSSSESDSRRDRRRYEEEAKRISREYPVILTCRDHAVNTPEQYGIWERPRHANAVRRGSSRVGAASFLSSSCRTGFTSEGRRCISGRARAGTRARPDGRSGDHCTAPTLNLARDLAFGDAAHRVEEDVDLGERVVERERRPHGRLQAEAPQDAAARNGVRRAPRCPRR